ncbi:hypothetical protein LDENG_00139200 [Lucifuga dentata]|nr:hypothetical protein LDENG_00139200 [Lucifuga dentata]
MRTGGVTRSVSPDGCRASMLPWRHLFLFVLLWRADLSESGCIHYLKDLSLAGNRPNNTLMLVDVVTPRISKVTFRKINI